MKTKPWYERQTYYEDWPFHENDREYAVHIAWETPIDYVGPSEHFYFLTWHEAVCKAEEWIDELQLSDPKRVARLKRQVRDEQRFLDFEVKFPDGEVWRCDLRVQATGGSTPRGHVKYQMPIVYAADLTRLIKTVLG